MSDNTNKQKAVNAIWENPARVFGCGFRPSGRYLENLRGGDYDERGKIRLSLTANGGNIMVFYNGGSRQEKTDVFTYLNEYVCHGAGFCDVLRYVAGVYGLTLEYTAEERQKIKREGLAREVAASMVEALRQNPTGEAATYLTTVRGLQPDGVHFGELSEQSIKRAVDYLTNKGYQYNPEDMRALGLTKEHAAQGYNLVIPYYRNGVVTGFVLRNTRTEHRGPKYLYSEGLGRSGYCDRLTVGEPAVIVEGQMDAVRLIQAGERNVIAMGGAKISEDIARLLKARNISQVTYMPDLEFNDQGEKKTAIIADAIKAFQNARVDGEPVITHLYVAELPTPEGVSLNGLKVDADEYGKNGGNLSAAVDFAVYWWGWELSNLIASTPAQVAKVGEQTAIGWFQNKFDEIYKRVVSPYEREQVKRYITGRPEFSLYGVTPEALNNVDDWNRNKQYTDAVKAATVELQQAVENGANPVKIGEAVAKLDDAQGTNTRAEWDAQLNQTFADELDAIKNQPDTLKTKWELGNISKTGGYIKYSDIEFYPADITVFCAATSHGKTAILFQSVFDLLRRYPNKTFLFVSCEENKRQLLERALNVYIDIQTTENGKTVEAAGTDAGKYCFISQTRKKSIKAAICGTPQPHEYPDYMGVSEHFNDVAKQVNKWVKRYETEIRPRLILIHTDGTAESIAANVLHYIQDYQNNGVEVGGVFVDYMQLLTSDNKNYSRHDELKDVCKALKRCAANTELPVIIAAQLNRESIKTGIDDITVANIGEGADIERIAHDIYLVWQTDKTKRDLYQVIKENGETEFNYKAAKERANRIFTRNELAPKQRELKTGYLYVEQMKARDGKTDGWGMFPFDGERGHVGENDKIAMKR